MSKCRECGSENKFIHEPYCDKYVPSIDEGLDDLYRGLKTKNRRYRTINKKLRKRIKALEGVVELAKQHMFFFTEIMTHRSESKKCMKKKCLVCAELEVQDTSIVINLMNAISKL